jgi:hypothetical protein
MRPAARQSSLSLIAFTEGLFVMRKTMDDAAENDKFDTAHMCRLNGTIVPQEVYASRVMQIAQAFIGRIKTSFKIADAVGCGERTARHWKQGEREMNLSDFMRLAADKKRPEMGAALFAMMWNELPEATKEAWFRQLESEKKSKARAARRRQLRAELEALESDQPELGFATR